MRLYSVHAPPADGTTAEDLLFVKDGFSWPALFLPVLYVIWHGLWLTLVYWVIFVLAVAWAGRLAGDNFAMLLAVAGSLLFAFEANNIRRLSLARRGFTEIGAASGRNISEAELRFFSELDKEAPIAIERREAVARGAFTPEAREQASDEPILGLFPEPER